MGNGINWMRQIVCAAAGVWLTLSGAAHAGDGAVSVPGTVVVELYTSQGCSSCPPADVLFAELAADPRLIALSLHVDYWDYLGWTDSFAQPKFTARQKAYAKAAGDRMIYTPQLVVGGADRVVGSDAADVAAAIERHLDAGSSIRLSVRREGDRLIIRAEAVPPTDQPLRIDLVRYLPEAEVAIPHGENAGHVVTYHNIVTSWEAVSEWRGDAAIEIEVKAEGPEPSVVLVQSQGPAEILAAAELK